MRPSPVNRNEIMKFSMNFSIIALIITLSSSLAFSQDTLEQLVIYSTSTPYNGKEMVVEFGHDEISDSPICKASDKEFPIKQSDAISRALNWAKKEFDSSKEWKVDSVNLKFISIERQHCLYIIELRPKNEMRSLNVGLLMNGKLIPPVAKQ